MALNIIISLLVPMMRVRSSIETVTYFSSAPTDDHLGVVPQVDAVGEQEAQRRLRQRIEVLGVEPAVVHHDRGAVRDHLDRRRRIVFEPDPAGLRDDRTCPRSCGRPGRPGRNCRPGSGWSRGRGSPGRPGRAGRPRLPIESASDGGRGLCRRGRARLARLGRRLRHRNGLRRRNPLSSQDEKPDDRGHPRPCHAHLASPVLALARLALPYGLFTTSGHVRINH